MELVNADLLTHIGNYLGTALKIDMTTLQQTRGKYAIICIQINLNNPLKAFILFRGQYFNLEYEGLNTICPHSGIFGHSQEVSSKEI